MRFLTLTLVAIGLAVSACAPKSKEPKAPGTPGDMECFQLNDNAYQEIGKANRVEDCAGMVDAIRAQGGKDEVRGAYQGAKLIVNQRGVYVSARGTAAFPLLTRTSDGQLIPPSQVPGAR